MGNTSQTGCVRTGNMKKSALLITISVLLTGCTTQWIPARSNPTPFHEANAECNTSALQRFPVKNEVAQTSHLRTVKNYCGKDCSYEQSVPMTESYIIDVNERSRNQIYRFCMQQNGWQQKTKYLL
ncbi:conserved hypothetical protein [Xenorhabdus cabanillasii JM26]|uniref:Uncharacterized protein n=3 Tax=Xenorhabdus cabanillasii TaxID=351673 RepID=A0A3D9UPF4_9GAMM|nr:hypothetical protein [Xenorhabdus cabanillasii]PHM78354.1 hypothetical protein Xcab_00967 [Xenorhabdus cabanillasii JM26]REF27884.1 hypothetical protein BDD26_2711 [Xenorhabdus cabanillasii]CDL87704.1 conserved hypothetical protein [Xenorhabdus cabanillasii JM26]